MTTDYQPVSCDRHSLLELLAMRRLPVTVEYRDEANCTQRALVVADDIETRNKAEYLIAKTPEGRRVDIRLDRIASILDEQNASHW